MDFLDYRTQHLSLSAAVKKIRTSNDHAGPKCKEAANASTASRSTPAGMPCSWWEGGACIGLCGRVLMHIIAAGPAEVRTATRDPVQALAGRVSIIIFGS